MPDNVIVTGADGLPIGVFSVDKIQADATRLMYLLAAHSGNPARLDEINAKFVDEIGPAAFGYVAAAALRFMTEQVLEPTLQAVDAAAPKVGRRLRGKLREGDMS